MQYYQECEPIQETFFNNRIKELLTALQFSRGYSNEQNIRDLLTTNRLLLEQYKQSGRIMLVKQRYLQ